MKTAKTAPKQVRVPNHNCREYVHHQIPFQGSNLFAEWRTDNHADTQEQQEQQEWYVVFSYGEHFPIYVYIPATNTWYANNDKYSRSTTRHQSQARPLNTTAPLHWLSADRMKLLAHSGYAALAKLRVVHGAEVAV
jgi:hypothetical protein